MKDFLRNMVDGFYPQPALLDENCAVWVFDKFSMCVVFDGGFAFTFCHYGNDVYHTSDSVILFKELMAFAMNDKQIV